MAQDYSKYKNLLDKNGKSVYDEYQMEQIRLGLEKVLDVDKYAILNKDGEPFYNHRRMEEIREDLEQCLDVDTIIKR